MSRPTKYNENTADKICLELIEGKSLRQICQADSMPCIATVFNWMKSKPEFLEQYTRAREL